MTFAEKAIDFNRNLSYTGKALPKGIRIMNPFLEFEQTMGIMETFYRKYYNDNRQRHLILGINPSRLGAGLTGIPFTDPKRLASELHINYSGRITHEPSSVFMYEMINAYGGPAAFYGDFYINSPCPLGFTSVDAQGRQKNYNYYDSRELLNAVGDYTVEVLHRLISLGINTDLCFCLGTGKNEQYLSRLNQKHGFFKKLVALAHPRFIMQYRYPVKQQYIDNYLAELGAIHPDI